MEHISLFDTNEKFKDNQSSLLIPNVTLVEDTNTVFYNFESDINIVDVYKIAGNSEHEIYLSKNNISFKKDISELYEKQYQLILHDGDNVTKEDKLTHLISNVDEKTTFLIALDILSLGFTLKNVAVNANEMKISSVDKKQLIEFTGLKRKDNGHYDFVGELGYFMDGMTNPLIIQSPKFNPTGKEKYISIQNNMTFDYNGQTVDFNLYELPKTTLVEYYKSK